ncbi:MAG TPA: formyltetrahydrofolate deformylase [Verrucomicrobiae bacterium]
MKQFATITVIGRDKTGVIARFTNALFQEGANIEALEEQVTRGEFSMILQASWDRSIRSNEVEERLINVGRTLAMEVTIHWTDPNRPQRMGIMVTKEPHCLEAIMQQIRARKLRVEPVVVISNRRDLEPLAKKYDLPFELVSWEGDRAKAEMRAIEILRGAAADFVVLARFMKILSPNFVWRYKNKIINVHPSLLPSFPGPQAYRQAYEHGVKIVGVTSHFVSMHLDEGPIIAQESFNVRPGMTLKDIVAAGQALESKVLVRALKLYLAKKLDVYWGVVKEV